jgi:hypothetical protein
MSRILCAVIAIAAVGGTIGGLQRRLYGTSDSEKRDLAGAASDDLFYPTLQHLEQLQRELRNDWARYSASVIRAPSDMSDIRQRWYNDQLDVSQKRTMIKEALHAVAIHPVGPKGRGRVPFNPDPLELVWRA